MISLRLGDPLASMILALDNWGNNLYASPDMTVKIRHIQWTRHSGSIVDAFDEISR